MKSGVKMIIHQPADSWISSISNSAYTFFKWEFNLYAFFFFFKYDNKDFYKKIYEEQLEYNQRDG